MASSARLPGVAATARNLFHSSEHCQTKYLESSTVGSAAGWAGKGCTMKLSRRTIAPQICRSKPGCKGGDTLSASSSVFLGSDFSHVAKIELPPTSSCVGVFRGARSFSQEKQELVIQSWNILKKNSGDVAVKFFVKIFQIAPSAKKLFSFLRDSDVPLEKNPKLRTHALIVLKTVAEAASQLAHKGALDTLRPLLLDLGKSHVVQGVLDEHFDVVKYALLRTIEEELPPEQDKSKVVDSWSEAYDELVGIIEAEMREIRAAQAAVPTPSSSG